MDYLFSAEKAEEELHLTRQALEAMSRKTAEAFLVSDLDGRIRHINEMFERMFGWSKDETVNHKLPIVPESMAEPFERLLVQSGCEISELETIRRRKDGSEMAVSETIAPIRNSRGQTVAYLRFIREIAEQGEAQQASGQKYKSLFDDNPDAIFSLDESGCFQNCNPVVQQLTGFSEIELQALSLSRFVLPSEEGNVRTRFQSAVAGITQNFETRILHKSGRTMELNIVLLPARIGGRIAGVYAVAKDITARKQTEHMVRYMAYHDPLTDLPNRRLFHERITGMIGQAEQRGEQAGLLLVDLDEFKTVNDTLGHTAGDTVLQFAAKRLKNCLREADTVARMGGDEFTILLPRLQSPDQAVTVAKRVLAEMSQPFEVGGQTFYISASVGIAVYPDNGKTPEELLRHADSAMYHVKDRGKNNIGLFSLEMVHQDDARIQMARDMMLALEHDQFVLYYQPQINVETGRISSMEALIRWNHPERGMLPPGQFIPLAEANGAIVPVGEWVIRTACKQCKMWQLAGYRDLHMAVNVSMRQFQDDRFVEIVAGALQEADLEAVYLELEITESLTMRNQEEMVSKLRHLAGIGVRISIDDFGTGFSSLHYLRTLPIHKLKIDRSFITDITNRHDAAIVSSIVSLARSLNLGIIAEGVETSEQRELLPELGCSQMQGYYFSRPVPPDQAELLLKGTI